MGCHYEILEKINYQGELTFEVFLYLANIPKKLGYLEPARKALNGTSAKILDKNIETNLEALKNYIKETVLDVETHRYGRFKKFFTPIIITPNKIYYLKAGSFMNEYRMALREGLHVFSIKHNKKERD